MTYLESLYIIKHNFRKETVEAEIKTYVHSQRVRGAENRVKRSLLNGPPRARGKGRLAEYSVTCRHTSVAGDMLVSC